MKSMQLKFTLVEGTSVHVKQVILYNVQVIYFISQGWSMILGLENFEILELRRKEWLQGRMQK